MTKRLTWFITSVAAFFLVAMLVLTGATGLTANAQEIDPEPTPVIESGWYVMGSGAGSLKECSWTKCLTDFRADGEGTENNYIGTFYVDDLDLYPADAFKLLYNDGTWTEPDNDKWNLPNHQVQFENITNDPNVDFVDGGLGNIQCEVSGNYSFTLTVSRDDAGTVTIALSYKRNGDVKPIVMYDMYVVGHIEGTDCVWPSDAADAEAHCIHMIFATIEGEEKYVAKVSLTPDDEFKVYNAVTGAYYPAGVDNNWKVDVAGEYVIEWGVNAPDIAVYPAADYPYPDVF